MVALPTTYEVLAGTCEKGIFFGHTLRLLCRQEMIVVSAKNKSIECRVTFFDPANK